MYSLFFVSSAKYCMEIFSDVTRIGFFGCNAQLPRIQFSTWSQCQGSYIYHSPHPLICKELHLCSSAPSLQFLTMKGRRIRRLGASYRILARPPHFRWEFPGPNS